MKIYSYTYGTCLTEQDLVTVIDDFLLNTVGGWTRIEKVSDTASNRDYAWKSPGENPERGEIYIRIRAQSDNLYNYGYGVYVNSGTYGHELYNASYTYVSTSGYPFKYWIYGDKDFVCYNIYNTSAGYVFTGYLGFIKSYYIPATDRVPLLVKGTPSYAYTWPYSTSCNYMYNTTSGATGFLAYNQYTNYLVYDTGRRSGGATLVPIPLYNSTAGAKEVRGEPNGVYQIHGMHSGNIAPLSTASGIFICFKQNNSDTVAYAYGPVSASIAGFSM